MVTRKRKTVEQRLWAKIEKADPDDCWLWTGAIAGKGYGHLMVRDANDKKVMEYAHRLVLKLAKGDPEDPSHQALHSCDTPRCCNPKHLSWGTNARNRREARDRLHNQGNQKLRPEQVEAIRETTGTHREIAEIYGVHFDTIARIKQGRSWQPSTTPS